MAVIWRRTRAQNNGPDQVLRRAREVEIGLRSVLADLRTNLDQLEAEVYRPESSSEEA